MSLTVYLRDKGFVTLEGNSGEIKMQQEKLIELCSNDSIKSILEIGFNGGHSADLFLSTSNANVVSFDLGENLCVQTSKDYIDMKYPSRHRLILGNSIDTIPQYISQYISQHPTTTFDLIFIDGGHDYAVAIADILNCSKLAHANTVVIMDDVIIANDYSLQRSWTLGPSKAWAECIMNGVVCHISAEMYCVGRGMVWGTFSQKAL
jgi:predicted O-methyltransferase YrrM